jgi:hypothetical protein
LPSDRDELLDRVYARANGLWWRRRFAPITAGVVVLSLAVGVPLLRAGDSGHRPTKLATAPNETTSTAASGIAGGESTPSTIGPQPTTTRPSGVVSTVATKPSPTTSPTTTRPTTPPSDRCRNNNGDSSCGEFHWATDPGPNAPLTFEISSSPAAPKTGQTVTFTVHVIDPDASPINDCGADYAGGGGGCAHTMECAANYGAWDVPAKQRGEATFTYQHVFSSAGTYTVKFFAESMQGSKTNGSCAGQPNPYASDGAGTKSVTVT